MRSPGVGHGRLVGGNLSLIAADVGVEPPPEVSAIAVFEDIGEDGYRIDRMLTQLLRSRWFDQVTGVVVGEFSSGRRRLAHLVGAGRGGDRRPAGSGSASR